MSILITNRYVDGEKMKKAKALLIDDSKIDQLAGKYYMESCGLDVETADNGVMALQQLAEKDYDIVFVDLLMPRMGGFELIQRLRSRVEHKEIPIIILSSKSNAHDIQRSLKLKVNDYIIKPLKLDVLKNKIKSTLLNYENRFSEIPLLEGELGRQAICTVSRQIEIQSMSVTGLTFKSDYKYDMGSFIKLESPLLKKFGLCTDGLRISSCLKSGKTYYYKVKFNKMTAVQKQEVDLFLASQRSYGTIS